MEQIILSLQKLSFAEPAIKPTCPSNPTNKQLSDLCLHFYYENTALKNQIQRLNDQIQRLNDILLQEEPTKMPVWCRHL